MSDAQNQTELKLDTDKAALGIENLAAQASTIDAESALFTPTPPQAKKGRGRPKKVAGAAPGPQTPPSGSMGASAAPQPENPQVHITSKEILKPTFLVMSGWLGRAIDEKAKLKDEEIEQLSGAYGLLFDKYAPIVTSKYGLELSVAAITATVGMRVYAVAKEKQDLKREKMKKERAQFEKAAAEARPVESELMNDDRRPQTGTETYPLFGMQ